MSEIMINLVKSFNYIHCMEHALHLLFHVCMSPEACINSQQNSEHNKQIYALDARFGPSAFQLHGIDD